MGPRDHLRFRLSVFVSQTHHLEHQNQERERTWRYSPSSSNVQHASGFPQKILICIVSYPTRVSVISEPYSCHHPLCFATIAGPQIGDEGTIYVGGKAQTAKVRAVKMKFPKNKSFTFDITYYTDGETKISTVSYCPRVAHDMMKTLQVCDQNVICRAR